MEILIENIIEILAISTEIMNIIPITFWGSNIFSMAWIKSNCGNYRFFLPCMYLDVFEYQSCIFSFD